MTVWRHDISVVHHPLEWFWRRHETEFIEKAHPKTAVQQVCYRVISTVVIINRRPVLDQLWIPRLLVIVRVEIAQEVPTGAGVSVQRISFASTFTPIVARWLWLGDWHGFTRFNINPHAYPIINLCQYRSIAARRLEILDLWQNHRQALVRHSNWLETVNMDHRNWRAPVPLTRNQPVTHFVSSFTATRSLLFQPRYDLLAGIFTTRTVELPRINQFAFARVTARIRRILWLINHLHYWQIKFFGKFQVAFIMRRHRHNRASAVTAEDVIRHPNWHFLAVDWIDSITTSKYAGFIFIFLAFNVGLLLCRLNICFNFSTRVGINQLRH